jgi:hypothetical protein
MANLGAWFMSLHKWLVNITADGITAPMIAAIVFLIEEFLFKDPIKHSILWLVRKLWHSDNEE